MNLLDGLNEAQSDAVLHGEGPVLVLAGAGSGKTRVLTGRVAHLIASGVPPFQLIALTFTNKAAREMRDRVRAQVGAMADDLWISTFHSACVRILRDHAERLGYTRHFTVMDGDDQRALVRSCLRALEASEKQWPPGTMLGMISRWKNEGVGPREASAAAGDPFRRMAARVFSAYERRLREANAMDFDDLLLQTVRLFREHEDVAAMYAARFRHVLVDEYQDTNRLQYEIVRALSAVHRNVFVVGDVDQSIYGWRGADIRNILDFERDFPDARVIKLEQNYRSTQRILDAAGRLIRNNEERRERDLWSDLGAGEAVKVFSGWDDRAEADFVAGEIESRSLREGRPLSDFAVLYRTHAQSRVLEEAFLARGLPYHIVGGVNFYERREVKDALAYLRLLANPRDEVSFERIANVPRRGLGPASLAKVLAARDGRDIPETLLDAENIAGLTGAQRERLRELGALLARLRDSARELSVAETLRRVLEESGMRADLEGGGDPHDLARLENLDELLNVAAGFPANEAGTQLDDFLAEAALVAEADAYDPDRPAVALLTVHSAKGLEFPVVFLVGMEEGIFPHSRAIDEGTVEEERRLCYVGMTRAQRALYLCCAKRRSRFGEAELRMPSRFLEEAGREELEEVGAGGLAAWQGGGGWRGDAGRLGGPAWARAAIRRARDEDAADAAPIAAGDRVRHALWGTGTVVALRGEGEDAEVTVAFNGAGVRRLLVRYAKLKPVD